MCAVLITADVVVAVVPTVDTLLLLVIPVR